MHHPPKHHLNQLNIYPELFTIGAQHPKTAPSGRLLCPVRVTGQVPVRASCPPPPVTPCPCKASGDSKLAPCNGTFCRIFKHRASLHSNPKGKNHHLDNSVQPTRNKHRDRGLLLQEGRLLRVVLLFLVISSVQIISSPSIQHSGCTHISPGQLDRERYSVQSCWAD